MAKAPAFQLFAVDFLSDTLTWSAQELGVHLRLMMWSWDNGPVPVDMKRICRIDPEAAQVWDIVGPKWIANGQGGLTNPRLEKTRADQAEYRGRQAERGRRSAALRAAVNEPEGNQPATELPTEGQPEPQPKANPRKGEPLIEDGGEVEDGEVVEGRRPKGKGPDTRIDRCIEHFTEKAGHKPADASKWLRIHVANLLKWVEAKAPSDDAVASLNALIDAALAIDFHRNNATTFRYLYDYRETIYKTFKNGRTTSKSSSATPAEAARRTAEYFARKREGGGTDA